LDGGSQNEKNEQGRAEQECAEHVHGQNLLRREQYRCGNWPRTVLPVTADGDAIWPASITSPAPPLLAATRQFLVMMNDSCNPAASAKLQRQSSVSIGTLPPIRQNQRRSS
jgi:hypothetical protein